MKLEPDLIPKTSWFRNVRSEVTTVQWDRIRHRCYSDAGYKCEICSGVGPKHPVECHERWEYDEKNAIQTLIGMIALCPNCHEVIHFGLAQVKGRDRQAMKHLCKVNGITMDKGLDVIDRAFEIWNKRNAVDWQVDISYLDTFGG